MRIEKFSPLFEICKNRIEYIEYLDEQGCIYINI